MLIILMCLPMLAFAAASNPYEEVESHVFNWPLPNCPDTNSPMYDRTGVVSGSNGYHTGWDFAVAGGTEIYAIGAGKVLQSGYANGIGNYCVIEHTLKDDFVVDLGNGETVNYGKKIYSRYCHMIETPRVRVGQSVQGGETVGFVGSTGLSTGNHLHLDIMSKESGVKKALNKTEGFLPYSTWRDHPVYKVLCSKGAHTTANFAPNIICGVLSYVGLVERDHPIDLHPDYGTGGSFGTGSAGSSGESMTSIAYDYIGAVSVSGGRLVSELLNPGTGITDREDDERPLTYTGVMTDYGTMATFNNLASKMKGILTEYSKTGAAIVIFIGTVSVGFGIILKRNNPEERSLMVTGLFAVGVGSLIVFISIILVNMIVEYM